MDSFTLDPCFTTVCQVVTKFTMAATEPKDMEPNM
jgi:hypothetical protein